MSSSSGLFAFKCIGLFHPIEKRSNLQRLGRDKRWSQAGSSRRYFRNCGRPPTPGCQKPSRSTGRHSDTFDPHSNSRRKPRFRIWQGRVPRSKAPLRFV